jgi:hypothetical protein
MSDRPDFDIELPEPWYWTNQDLTGELRQELSPQHQLYDVVLKTIARRLDRDDVLFEATDAPYAYTIVHLTWRMETDPKWPTTVVFDSWDQVLVRIEADARDFK